MIGADDAAFQDRPAFNCVGVNRTDDVLGDAEPVTERLIRVLEDGPGKDREPTVARSALGALPMPRAGMQLVDVGIAATRAMDTIRPPAGLQIGAASVLIPAPCPGLSAPTSQNGPKANIRDVRVQSSRT